VFRNAEVKAVAKYEEGEGDKVGAVKYSLVVLEDMPFVIMESSLEHKFKANESVSFVINCEDQAEVDYYFGKLSAVPESEQCGWVKDKYGISWQVTPRRLGELLSSPDKEKADRALQAMLHMKKLDIAELERAYNGE
jgi:predicted 3-demethylubiquinone-9 3-methyltransferase (glyoxalase superfamily)